MSELFSYEDTLKAQSWLNGADLSDEVLIAISNYFEEDFEKILPVRVGRYERSEE